MAEPEKKRKGIWSRRDFFTRLGLGGLRHFRWIDSSRLCQVGISTSAFSAPVNLQSRNATDYSMGEVSEKYKQEQRVWIVREEAGIYAIFAKCTHLGCTPRWLAAENKFKCPCHGSGFFKSGLNFEGPAPRPLDRFKVTVGDDGQLVVDKAKVFKMGPGAEPDEQYADSVLKV